MRAPEGGIRGNVYAFGVLLLELLLWPPPTSAEQGHILREALDFMGEEEGLEAGGYARSWPVGREQEAGEGRGKGGEAGGGLAEGGKRELKRWPARRPMDFVPPSAGSRGRAGGGGEGESSSVSGRLGCERERVVRRRGASGVSTSKPPELALAGFRRRGGAGAQLLRSLDPKQRPSMDQVASTLGSPAWPDCAPRPLAWYLYCHSIVLEAYITVQYSTVQYCSAQRTLLVQ